MKGGARFELWDTLAENSKNMYLLWEPFGLLKKIDH
jgi:hypothetical protein